ncbi:hypothetical protein BDM02DRAFT_3142497 [Thelephora ganbajun]|uniref:Uncharacterized protein n=1 Tax=Thelephora ganbajun TaxID=370292 RepID=A0ACB6ZIP9_THEGA|nr:hypothetical protein BDM02DRAFT_3142497 [Thelephora ganbajun]
MPLAKPREIPSQEIILAVSELDVLGENGRAVTFGSLFEQQKTLAVFIRALYVQTTFWLFLMSWQPQSYMMQLASIPRKELGDANVQLIVIGCGSWDVIPSYKEITGFNGEVYADPSRSIFRTLELKSGFQGLTLTPLGQKKKSYITRVTNNTPWYSIRGLIRAFIKNPRFVGKIGNMTQLGGDFVFGPGPICTFASRMQHAEDHVEVSELTQHLGISARPPSLSQMLAILPVSEQSRRNCSELLPDELVVVPSQLEDPGYTRSR